MGHTLSDSGIVKTRGRDTPIDFKGVKKNTGHSFETFFAHFDTMAPEHSNPARDSKRAKEDK